jgi:Formate--tetrahydrofolate ligase
MLNALWQSTGTSSLDLNHVENYLNIHHSNAKLNAILRFGTDTEAELECVRNLCLAHGAYDAVVANHWAEGGAGATGASQMLRIIIISLPLSSSICSSSRNIINLQSLPRPSLELAQLPGAVHHLSSKCRE